MVERALFEYNKQSKACLVSLSKTEMKNLNVVLDLAREEVEIGGETRRLLITKNYFLRLGFLCHSGTLQNKIVCACAYVCLHLRAYL